MVLRVAVAPCYNVIMKILQLNVWMGKVEGNLERFLQDNSFDIICMQEVMHSDTCKEHLSRLCVDTSRLVKASGMPYMFFSPNWRSKLADGNFELGNLILSRIPFTETTSEFVNGKFIDNMVLTNTVGNNLNIQIAKLENGLTVVNHHGFWRPSPIGDKGTVKAFKKAASIVKKVKGPLVMCGDLNVIHDSPAMRSFDFLTDLTYENHIDNTLSGIKYNGKVACDHILVNDKISVSDFKIRPEIISDHLALESTFALRP